MKNLKEEIERINMLSEYQLGVVISEQYQIITPSNNGDTTTQYRLQRSIAQTGTPVYVVQVKYSGKDWKPFVDNDGEIQYFESEAKARAAVDEYIKQQQQRKMVGRGYE